MQDIDTDFIMTAVDLAGAAAEQGEKLASAESALQSYKQKIQKFDEGRAAFVKRATEAAKVLAERGVIGSDNVNAFVDRIADDPTSVWGVVEKMAGSSPAPTLGRAADVKSQCAVDPWSALLGGSQANGYID